MSKSMRYLVTAAAAFLVGWSAHWHLTKPEPVQLVSTPAKRLANGGLQAESRVDPKAKAKQSIPLGSKVTHVGEVKIQPRRLAGRPGGGVGKGLPDAKDGATEGAACSCEPLTLDYSLFRSPGGQEFVRWSSPQGEILEATDTIVGGLEVTPASSWSIGAGRGPNGRLGMRVDRDLKIAPLRLGLDLQQGADQRLEPWLWVNLRF